jgi:hypothetical protein
VAETVHGYSLAVQDVPQRGLIVRISSPYDTSVPTGVALEPAEAAELGAALIRQAEEAVHESRRRRRG